jgi:DNA-binding HxlR family transcriptional regulator
LELENLKCNLKISSATVRRVKSYGQYCAIARGLDVVGDRWTLLIVRELLTGPRRYGDLQEGLAGIATNLLADRLRHLEQQGVVDRDSRGTYTLTKWGQGLAEPIYALARWAGPLMAEPAGDDQFRSSWLVPVVAGVFGGVEPSRPEMTIEIQTGDSPMTIVSTRGQVQAQPGPANNPDLVISGPPEGVIGLLAGALDKDAASECGVVVQGDIRRLSRLRGAGRPRITT